MAKVGKEMLELLSRAADVMNKDQNVVFFSDRPGFYPKAFLALRWGEKQTDIIVLEVGEGSGIVFEGWLTPARGPVAPQPRMLKSPGQIMTMLDALILEAKKQIESRAEPFPGGAVALETVQSIREQIFGQRLDVEVKEGGGEAAPGVH